MSTRSPSPRPAGDTQPAEAAGGARPAEAATDDQSSVAAGGTQSAGPAGGTQSAVAAGGTQPAGPVAARIRSLLPSLVPSDAKVARTILSDRDVVYHSVAEMAQAAGTSASTVVRCCQRLGFRGFQDLKIALAREYAVDHAPMPAGLESDDSPRGALAKILASSAEAIRNSAATIDGEVFERSVEAITAAGRLLMVAVGTSAPLAQDAAYRFLTLGVSASAPLDVHTQHVAAGLLTPGDVCLAVSHSGATVETVSTVEAAREAGATTIAVTSYAHSPLTQFVDLQLVAGGPELSFRLEAMASRLAHLTVLDALYVAVALTAEERAQASLDITADVLAKHRY